VQLAQPLWLDYLHPSRHREVAHQIDQYRQDQSKLVKLMALAASHILIALSSSLTGEG
jgi:hypothetical protein